MADIGASIEAFLKLNITNFENNAKKAIGIGQNLDRELSKIGTGGISNLGNSFSNLQKNVSSFGNTSGNVLSTFGKQLNEARAHTDSFGTTFANQSKKISAEMSTLFPGDAISRQLGLGQAAMASYGAMGTSAARSLRQEWATSASQASVMGRNARAAYPLEHIWNTEKAQASLNKQVIEASGSFAATGRSFTAAESTMTSGFGRVSNAASKVGSAVGTIGKGLSYAVNQLDTFSAGMLGLVGVMGSQQVYDFTVGLANTYQGYIQFWQSAYGAQTSQLYQQTIELMQSQYYSQPATTAKTLQLLANTMPTTTSPQDVASLTPMVQAYINFYKKMKPEFASLAEIEGPQDIAAVFSGNTGEIRASPLAQPLKEIAALPDEQKMAALKALFNDRGIMQFVSGLTAYDKEMNKFNASLNELEIEVGTDLLPIFTSLLGKINEFLKANPELVKFGITLAGVMAVFAAVGGIGSLFFQGLSAGFGIITTLGAGMGTLTAKVLSVAGAEVVLDNATKGMTASNVRWGATLKGVGSSLMSFLVSPAGIAVVAIGALIAAIVLLGNKYGWFKSALTKANEEMGRLNTQTTNATNRQNEAQQRVTELTNKLSQQAQGTPEWIQTKQELAQAEIDLRNATTNTVAATANAAKYQKDLAAAQAVLADSYKSLYRAYIAYQLASGAITPEQAQGRLGAAEAITEGNYAEIDSMYKTAEANNQATNAYSGTTSAMTEFGKAVGNLPAIFTPLWNPLDRLRGYIASFLPGGDSDPSKIDWSNFNPLKVFSMHPEGGVTDTNSVFGRIASFFGINPFSGGNNTTTPTIPTTNTSGILPGASYAADGGNKPGIMEDIFGKSGILRGTGLESGGSINSLFKNLKFPTAAQILNLFEPKIPVLSWKIPNPTQILSQTWQKINPLHWKIPGAGEFLGQTWQKINPLNWRIPGAWDFLNQTWQKIKELWWQVPNPSQILGEVAKKIHDFIWPMGPSNVGGGSGGGGGKAFGPPMGPVNDTIVSKMSSESGVGSGYIANALSKRFNGVSAFNDIANGISDHLSYTFYMGDQKSNREVWNSGQTNCYDGAQFLISEASQRFGLGAGMNSGVWNGTAIPHSWATVGGQPFDMAAKLLRSQWNPPSGPSGLEFAQFMTDIGPGLEYVGYGGHGKDPYSALGTGGNCFDMTLGVMGIASQLFGLPSEMVWGTYEGQSHVWARIGNKDYDPTRMALTGSYNPPPRGPLKETPKQVSLTVINQFEKEVFGVDDFEGRVKDASRAGAIEVLNQYFK